MGFAILLVFVGFVLNFAQNSGGIGKTIASAAIVVAVVGVAYFISTSHGWLDGVVLYVTNGVGQPMLDAAGEPIPFGIGKAFLSIVKISSHDKNISLSFTLTGCIYIILSLFNLYGTALSNQK